jgi:selenocysteine-specific elongation factor
VVGEITTDHLIVALNKVDLLPPEGREQQLDKIKKKLAAVFNTTKFK